MIVDSERGLTKRIATGPYLPAVVPEGEGREGGSLPSMLASVVKELDALPFLRSTDDLPEDIRYLRNESNGILVMVSRRRPGSISYRGSEMIIPHGHKFGYFAEAYQEIDGIPCQRIDDPSRVWNGIYQRVEISDAGDIYSMGLTPTDFSNTKRRVLEFARPNAQLALPEESSVETSGTLELQRIEETGLSLTDQKGVIAKLFDASNAQTEEMEKVAEGISASITREFTPRWQGISPETGLTHLIISDLGADSPLVEISKRLGLNPYVLPSWRISHDADPFVRHVIRQGGDLEQIFPAEILEDPDAYRDHQAIRNLRQEVGTYPLVVTIDLRALEKSVHQRDHHYVSSNLRLAVSDESGTYPIFAIIEIGKGPDPDDKSTQREGAGKYRFQSEDISEIQGLLVKIGVDYALTKQVRGLAALVPAVGKGKTQSLP